MQGEEQVFDNGVDSGAVTPAGDPVTVSTEADVAEEKSSSEKEAKSELQPGSRRRQKRAKESSDILRRMDMADLERMRLQELRELAREYQVSGYSGLKKDDLILLLLKAKAEREGFIFGGGILEITNENIGFLRSSRYVPVSYTHLTLPTH
mgnify:CR=1 FL=1